MKTELITNEFADIDVTTLPKFSDVDELSSGCFAQRFAGSVVRKPSLLFVEKVKRSHDGLVTVYWHWVNQFNGFELNTWATTFRKEKSIAFEKGYCWADLYTNATERIVDAPRQR